MVNEYIGPVVPVRLPDRVIRKIDRAKPAGMARARYLREVIITLYDRDETPPTVTPLDLGDG